MAVKRKTEQIHANVVAVKEKRAKTEVDPLTNLPESLQLRILSLLDARYAVQTSAVSKTWLSLWMSVPVLQFNSLTFAKLRNFDNFVAKVLRLRDPSATLETLMLNRHGVCSANMLSAVFCYAFSHGVKNIEAFIRSNRNKPWPIVRLETRSESLESLKLRSETAVTFPFLSRSFKNLSDLYLKRARILDPELFSGFPALKKLTLIGCHFDKETVGATLNIRAPQLTELTIASYNESIRSYQLTAPKLRFFEYRGSNFPRFETHGGGLPVLETAVIDFLGYFHDVKKLGGLDALLSLFAVVRNVKSLTLFASVVYFLSLFQDELVKQESPFRNLSCLRFDLENLRCSSVFYKRGKWSFELSSEVQRYLFQKSPRVNWIFVNLNPRD